MTPSAGAGRRGAQALFLLYQWDLTGRPLQSLFEGTPELRRRARRSGGRARRGARRADHGRRRRMARRRLGTLERNIMRIGVYEIEEGACPPRSRSTRLSSCEALRNRGGRQARERGSRRVREARRRAMTRIDEALGRMQELLERLPAASTLSRRWLRTAGRRRGGRDSCRGGRARASRRGGAPAGRQAADAGA